MEEKIVDATEDVEKATSEALDQPVEEEVNGNDGEETEESEDEFEIAVARHAREGIGGDSGSDWEPE